MNSRGSRLVGLAVIVFAVLVSPVFLAAPASAASRTAFTTMLTPLEDDPAWFWGRDWSTNMDMTYHRRDEIEVMWWAASDPRLTGRSVQTLEGDANWRPGQDAAMAHLRGKLRMSVDFGGGGVWKGSFTATHDFTTGVSEVRGHGRGVRGSVAGLHFTFDVVEQPEGDINITGVGYVVER